MITQQDRKVAGSIPTDATRRLKPVCPMELQPENWAGPRAVTWGLRILDKGEVGLKVPHEGLEFCCVYLYAHEACAPPTDGLCSGSPAGTGGPRGPVRLRRRTHHSALSARSAVCADRGAVCA